MTNVGAVQVSFGADLSDLNRGIARATATVQSFARTAASVPSVDLRTDASGLARELGSAIATVERLAGSATASIPVTADTADFTRDVQRATASVGKLAGADVTLRADASGLKREVGQAEAAVQGYSNQARAAAHAKFNADASGVVREANRAAEAVQRLTDRATAFQNVGRNLSIGVTAPLLALGGASLVAAGRIESLEIGMEAITGSAKEAQAQIARLQEIAKAPGIGFEQAIKGSIQLQSVALSAELAERALAGVARAVALGGGGEEQFGGVLRQLQQVAGAGKLMGDELKVILENAPAIAPALRAAFGSSSAEQIRDLGLTTEQFFERLVGGLETLPQVSGGLANSFENLRQAATRALASLISDEERTRLTASITALSARIESAAKSFSALPTPVRAGAIALAVLAAATGPVLVGLGLLIRSYQTFIGVSLVSTLTAQAGAFLALATSVRSVNDAMALLAATAPRTMAVLVGAGAATTTFARLALSVRSVSDATALIGAAAVPLTRFLAPVLGGAVAFGKLALSVRSVPAAIALFGAAFPGVSAAIGAVVSAAAGIAAAFTAPVALAVAAVVGLGAVIYVFRDEIGGAFQAVGGFLRTVAEQFVTFGALVTGVVIYPFIRAWEQARDAFGGVLRGIATFARDIFTEVGATVEHWRVLAVGSVRAAWTGMVAAFRGNEIVRSVTGIFDAITGYLARQVAVFSAAGNRLVNGLIQGIADTARKLPGLGPVVADRIETLLGGAGQVAVANAAGARVAAGFAAGVTRAPAVRIAPPVVPRVVAPVIGLEQATKQAGLLASALDTLPKGSAAFANATKQATALQAQLTRAIQGQGAAVTDVSVGYQDAANQLAKAMNPDAPKGLTKAARAASTAVKEAADAAAGLADQFRQFQALRDLGVSDLTKLPAGLREVRDEAERLRREYTDLLATLATPGVVVPPGFDAFAQSLRTNLEAADREVQTRVAGMARALRDGLPVDLSLMIDAAPAVGAVDAIRSAVAVTQGAFADLSRRASAGLGGTAEAITRARAAVARLAEQLANVQAAPGVDLTALRAGLAEGQRLLAGLDGPTVPVQLASLGPALAGAVQQVESARPVLDVTARLAPLGPLFRDLDNKLQAGAARIVLNVPAPKIVDIAEAAANAAARAMERAGKAFGVALQASIQGLTVIPLTDTDRLVQAARQAALILSGAIPEAKDCEEEETQNRSPIELGAALLGEAISGVSGLLTDFAGVLPAPLAGIVSAFATGALNFAKSVTDFGPKLESLLGPLAGPVNAALNGLVKLGGVALTAAGAVGGFVAGIGGQLLAIFNPFKIIASLLDEAFRAVAPSIEVLKEPVAEIARILSAALVPVLNALTPVFQSLVPVIQALAPIISGVGQVLGALFKPLIPVLGALVPLFRAFFPVFKLLAVIATYTGQALFKMGAIALDVIGAIAVGFGKIVEGIARAVDKLPGISAKGAIQAGKDIQAYGRAVGSAADGFRDAADALGVARKEIKAIELDDSLATAADGAASALVAFGKTLSDQTQLQDLLAGVFDVDDSPLVKLQSQLDLLGRFAPDLAAPFAGLDVATEAGRAQIEEALRNLALMIASGTIPDVSLGNLESITELITLVSGADSALDELTQSTLAQADAARNVTEALTNIPEIFDLTRRRMQSLTTPSLVVPVAPEVLVGGDPNAALETFRRLLEAIPPPVPAAIPLDDGWSEPPAVHPGWAAPPADIGGFVPETPFHLPPAPEPIQPRDVRPQDRPPAPPLDRRVRDDVRGESRSLTIAPGAIVVQAASDPHETARAVIAEVVNNVRRGGTTELVLALGGTR